MCYYSQCLVCTIVCGVGDSLCCLWLSELLLSWSREGLVDSGPSSPWYWASWSLRDL